MWLALKNLIFTLVMPGSVAVWIPLWIMSGDRARSGATAVSVARGALAWIPFAIGAAIYLWCLWDFATFGRGTPAPIDAPKRLVVRGLYRYVRNPMYLGVLTVIVGWCVRSGWWLWSYLATVAVGFNVFVLLYEEPTLRRLFGAEYERYCAAVGRWIPGRPYRAVHPA